MSYYSVAFVHQENEEQYSDTLPPPPPPRRMADHAINNFKLGKTLGVYML